MNKLRFSGHETFIARTFWPKKGYDFLINEGDFNAEDAVIKLGVGKNMVFSIKYWMKSLNLLDDNNELTSLADFLFGENGNDPFLEDITSIWLLHYYLIKIEHASIFSLVFNDLRKERPVFTKKQLHSFIKRQFQEQNVNGFNSNTIDKDASVLMRTYNTPDYKSIKKDFEDEIGGLFQELELMTSKRDTDLEGKNVDWYDLTGKERPTLAPELVLFAILDTYSDSHNIGFRRLEIERNSPAMVFALSKEGLFKKLKEIESVFDSIIVNESAGNITLVIPEEFDKWDILINYYAR